MIDWEKRKKSEEWAKEKACEFVKADLDLTFAEWCYRQGEKDGIREFAEWLIKNMFNGHNAFWNGNTPNDKPLRMEDFIAEYEKEREDEV